MCTVYRCVKNIKNERYVFRKVDFKLNKRHHCKTYFSPVDERASGIVTILSNIQKRKYREKNVVERKDKKKIKNKMKKK